MSIIFLVVKNLRNMLKNVQQNLKTLLSIENVDTKQEILMEIFLDYLWEKSIENGFLYTIFYMQFCGDLSIKILQSYRKYVECEKYK